jgi:uncharacterized protein YutE (UPF0331/DUF86 family)
MANLSEKVEAELEQIEQALREMPSARGMRELSVLELAGTASLLNSFYHGVENILKQALRATGTALPTGAAWHRDLLQAACAHGIVSAGNRDRLAPYLAFRHFFTHAYGFELEVEQLQPLVRDVRAVRARFQTEVRRFVRAQERKSPAKEK